jgi:hypothetical protein
MEDVAFPGAQFRLYTISMSFKEKVNTLTNEHQGTLFWGGLGAYVVACDVFGKETLGAAFTRGMEHKVGRYVLSAGLIYTGIHLINAVPSPMDLFDKGIDASRRFMGEFIEQVEDMPDL